jgi:hypothetical protein
VRHHDDPWRASRNPYPMRMWIAYRVGGLMPQPYEGVIWAATEADALTEAFNYFQAKTPSEKQKVFVLKR